jgi:DNA (cytosine-5)-methyltransferase 1
VAKEVRKQFTAIGLTCGVGSMLCGARAAGFDVLGNVEWRNYYHYKDEQGRNTFTENFPGAKFVENVDHLSMDEIERMMRADIALGHPECGRFSILDGTNKKAAAAAGRPDRGLDPGDIPLFVELVGRMRPRFFVMDDLPKAFAAFSMERYAERLPDYDLFPEWVSNYGYGNPQKQRNRMFMIGSMKRERWAFRPGEVASSLTVADVIGDLSAPRRGSNIPNHEPHDMSSDCFRALNLGGYRKKNTWGEVRDYFKSVKSGKILQYEDARGQMMTRIGFVKGHWDGPAHVLTGGNACIHALRCEPYTIRERARIQGFPDDFIFYGTILNERGEWDHDKNNHLVRQTGKAMPVQFCEYAARQVMAHCRGEEFASSGYRLLPPSEHIDDAKRWYCSNVGYANQRRACGSCWLFDQCVIRTEKYGIGRVVDKKIAPPTRRVVDRSPKKIVQVVPKDIEF